MNQQEGRVFISFKQSRLPEEHKHLHLVIYWHTCLILSTMVLLVKFCMSQVAPTATLYPSFRRTNLPKVFLLLIDGMGFQSIAADLIHQFLKFLQSFQSTN